MEKQEVYDRVVKVVCEVLGVEAAMVESSSNFVFDLGAESTQSIQLVAAFEEEFDIDLDEEGALAVQSVGDAAEFISQCVNG
ncbi:MAG TPA: acyl carrier protein [Phycisphaerae bacterium]|nr:acyl carrier protein [Phycisphaerae bacterium]